jgi:hypothetical protein
LWLGAAAAIIAIVGAAAAVMSISSSPVSSTTTTTVFVPTTIPYSPRTNARNDVVPNLPCSYSNGEWQLTGTVHNSMSYPRRYQLVVDFVTTEGATVKDETYVELPHVGPDHSVSWRTTGAPGVAGISCVLATARAVPAT